MPYSSLEESYNVFKNGRSYAGRNIGIQPAFKFLVDFSNLHRLGCFQGKDVSTIFPLYVKNVKIPLYGFKKESYSIGPFERHFPIFENNGLELSIEFIEDNEQFIAAFIYDLQSSNFKDGKHNIANTFNIYVQIFNERSLLVGTYTYVGCYFLKAESVSYDYESDKCISYNVTFLANRYEFSTYENTSITMDGTGARLPSEDLLKSERENLLNKYTPSYKMENLTKDIPSFTKGKGLFKL